MGKSPYKLTFGYIYDFRNPPQWRRPWAEHYAETLDFIAWSETVGFAGAWIPEHHLAEDGYVPSPMVVLAAVAARTSKLRIGTGVALAPYHDPVRFAEDAALIDILSNGRLDLQLGIGYRSREAAIFGKNFKKRGRIVDEFLQILVPLLKGETVSFAGEFFNMKEARVSPPPLGHIPLYIGGFADKALERVARYGDGYFGGPEVSDRYLAKLREAGRDEVGARIRIPLMFTAVARDPADAIEELAPFYHHVNNSYGEWNHEDLAMGPDSPTLNPLSLNQFKASGILDIVTPEQAIDRFRALHDKIPLEHVIMSLPAGMPPSAFKKYAAVFAEEVIPAFA